MKVETIKHENGNEEKVVTISERESSASLLTTHPVAFAKRMRSCSRRTTTK